MWRTFEGFADFKTCNFLGKCNKIKKYENKNNLRTYLGLKSKKLRTSEGSKNCWCSYKKSVYLNLIKGNLTVHQFVSALRMRDTLVEVNESLLATKVKKKESVCPSIYGNEWFMAECWARSYRTLTIQRLRWTSVNRLELHGKAFSQM